GEGARLWTKEGEEFIDFGSGIGVVSVGHSHPQLVEGLCEQARRLIHTSNLYRIPPQEELARRIVELTDWEGEWGLFFCNSGAEANETALKIARKYGEVNGEIKRYKIITLKNSFHGRTISTLKATGQPKFHTYFGPFPDGFEYADSVKDVVRHLDQKTIGVMVELVQGEGGVNQIPKGEMRELATELKRRDILLIVDEVQTGVYRTGEFLASQLYKIEPDIVTLAKGLGGGVPIGAVLTRLTEVLEPGDHGSTFGGNYLSTRAGLEVLKILEEEYRARRLEERIKLFRGYLLQLKQQFPEFIVGIRQIGLMIGILLKRVELRDRVYQLSIEEGVLPLKAGPRTLRLLPPLTISEGEIGEGFLRLEKGFYRLKQEIEGGDIPLEKGIEE
ncbi:MAG: acetylornithine transaminase, partial [Campylobacterales bacterium]